MSQESRDPGPFEFAQPRPVEKFMLLLILLLLVATPAAAQSDIAFAPDVYGARRSLLLERAGEGVFILQGRDLTDPFGLVRQDSSFWYLTGVESPYAIAVLVNLPGEQREILFLPERFQFAAVNFPVGEAAFREASWNQPVRRLSPGRRAQEATGFAETLPVDEFASRLKSIAAGAANIFLLVDRTETYSPTGMERALTVRQQFERDLAAQYPDARIEDIGPIVQRLREVKDQHEIALMRRASQISAAGLIEVMKTVRPGMNDLEVAGRMEYVWKREGAQRIAFPPIVASGPSALTLYSLRFENYNSVDRTMRDGELVFIDYGAAEVSMYASDVCRTLPVSGTFTDEQRRYYDIVLEAQDAAFAVIRPGAKLIDVVRAAAAVFLEHGLDAREDIESLGPENVWGVMPSPTHFLKRGLGLGPSPDSNGIRVRALGHHIGLEALDRADVSRPLEAGMVFTVEPKLYMPDLGMAIMIEDVILVTDDGYENLSASAPRSVDEIERAMRR